MKNIIRMTGILAAASFLALSCNLQEFYTVGEPLASEVSISAGSVDLAAENGSSKLTVNANGEWVVAMNGCEWAKVTPMSGKGNTVVTVSASDNVDSYKEVQGPRSAAITFLAAEKTCKLTVNQAGEKGLDTKTTYKLITKKEDFDSTKSFLLVTKYNGEYYFPRVIEPIAKSSQYMYGDKVEFEGTEIEMPSDSKSWTVVPDGNGKYSIRQADGTFISHVTNKDSFTYPCPATAAEGEKYALAFEDGKAIFTNAQGCISQHVYNGLVEYSGRYPAADVKANASKGPDYLPVMYISAKAATDEVLSVDNITISSLTESAIISVKSNKTWKVRNHSDWVTSFTKSGSGNGIINVVLTKNASLEARTAEFVVIGETTNVVAKLTQEGTPE